MYWYRQEEKKKKKPKRNDKKDEKYFAEGKEYRGISAQLTFTLWQKTVKQNKTKIKKKLICLFYFQL